MINCRPVSSYDISIHASAKEATLKQINSVEDFDNFNPRLREGGDLEHNKKLVLYPYFNPRLREGGDTLLPMNIRQR